MPCTIRPAGRDDAHAISRLALQLGYPQPTEAIENRLAEMERLPGQAVFVAHDSGRVIGWAQVCGIRRLLTEPYAELVALVVDETARGSGTGRRLLLRAAAWATAEGFDELVIRTNVVRKRAHRFYEELGFVREKTQYIYRTRLHSNPAFERPGFDEERA